VVAALDAAKPKETSMTNRQAKRQTTVKAPKIGSDPKSPRKIAAKKPTTAELSHKVRRKQAKARTSGRPSSKQARVIASLRTPAGTTIDAIMKATGWQQHSVRGFLAGVVRKKLALDLVSEAGKNGRLYRIKGGNSQIGATVEAGPA
jgi:hypothetical protein